MFLFMFVLIEKVRVGGGMEEVGRSQLSNLILFFFHFSNSNIFFNSLASKDIYLWNRLIHPSLGFSDLQLL